MKRHNVALKLPVLLLAAIVAAGCARPELRLEPVYFPPPPATAHAVHLVSFNSLGEIATLQPSLLEMLTRGPANPSVQRPAGLAWHADCLYICDPGSDVVHVWNLADGKHRKIEDMGELQLLEPVDVAVSPDGRAFVADSARGCVAAYDAAGRSAGTISAGRDVYRPVALAVSAGRLHVADLRAHCVDVFALDGTTKSPAEPLAAGAPAIPATTMESASSLPRIDTWGQVSSEPGGFYFPTGLAVDAAGALHVADSFNSRVQVLDARGRVQAVLGRPGNHYGELGKPRRVAVGPEGVVFVADAEFGYVHLFNSAGQLLMLLGGPQDGPGGTPLPTGLAIAPTLPPALAALVPTDFEAHYYLFVANSAGARRLSLYAIGLGRGG